MPQGAPGRPCPHTGPHTHPQEGRQGPFIPALALPENPNPQRLRLLQGDSPSLTHPPLLGTRICYPWCQSPRGCGGGVQPHPEQDPSLPRWLMGALLSLLTPVHSSRLTANVRPSLLSCFSSSICFLRPQSGSLSSVFVEEEGLYFPFSVLISFSVFLTLPDWFSFSIPVTAVLSL